MRRTSSPAEDVAHEAGALTGVVGAQRRARVVTQGRAVAVALSGWTACGLPGVEDGGPQHARRRLLPAAVEERRQRGRALAGVDDRLLPARMRVRLVRGHEARAEPGPGGAQHERRGEPSPIGDAAGREHRHRGHGVGDGGDERERRDLAPDVPARLAALRDDAVDAGGDGQPRLGGGRDRVQHERAALVTAGDVRGRVAPGEAQDRHTATQADLDPLALVPVQHEVHAERPAGAGTHTSDRILELVRLAPRAREHPEPACLADGDDELDGGGRPDGRLHDRQLAPHEVAERRAQTAHARATAPSCRSSSSAEGIDSDAPVRPTEMAAAAAARSSAVAHVRP